MLPVGLPSGSRPFRRYGILFSALPIQRQPAAKVRNHHVVTFYQWHTFQRVCQVSFVYWWYRLKRCDDNLFSWNSLDLLHNYSITYGNASVVPHKAVYPYDALALVGRVKRQALCNSTALASNFNDVSS